MTSQRRARPLSRVQSQLSRLGPAGERAARALRAATIQARRRTRQFTFGPRRVATGGWEDFVDWFGTLNLSENAVLLIFAVIIGIAAALGIVAFYSLVDFSDALFITWPAERLRQLRNPAYRPLLTALGFVAASYVMRRWAPREDGFTVPDLKRRVAHDGGVVPPRPLMARSVARLARHCQCRHEPHGGSSGTPFA